MKYIVWMSDMFVSEIPSGGAEICDQSYMEVLQKNGYQIERIKTKNLTKDFIDKNVNKFWIVSNFAQMPDHSLMQYMSDKKIKFVHCSHDMILCLHRNPYKHGDEMICNCFPKNGPLHQFINKALAIFCQSDYHKKIWDKNSDNVNTVVVGNMWWESKLDYIESKLNENIPQKDHYIIFDSPFPHKNTQGCIEEANKKNLKYKLVRDLSQEDFIKELIEAAGIIFKPILAESLSRILVEARMCNCKIVTNNLSGAVHEPWFKMKGLDLVKYFKEEQPKHFMEIFNTVYDGVM